MKYLSFTLIIIVASFFTSCKKCDPANSSSGLIIEDAIIRVIGGHSGGQFISNASEYPSFIEMSLDGGVTYTPVDYSKYSVFALATTSSCSSGYNRNVNANAASETVTYSIKITECSTCDNLVTISNWVLTSKVPSHYTPIFSIN